VEARASRFPGLKVTRFGCYCRNESLKLLFYHLINNTAPEGRREPAELLLRSYLRLSIWKRLQTHRIERLKKLVNKGVRFMSCKSTFSELIDKLSVHLNSSRSVFSVCTCGSYACLVQVTLEKTMF